MLNELREKLTAEVQPVGEVETLLLEIIISASWKIKRLFTYERKNARFSADYRYQMPDKMMRYTAALQRQIYKAIHELERLHNKRIETEGNSFDIDSIISAISNSDILTEK